jgi:hypothetical protein
MRKSGQAIAFTQTTDQVGYIEKRRKLHIEDEKWALKSVNVYHEMKLNI